MIIFCDSGFSPKEVDYMYAEEYKAAKDAGFTTKLISFEALQKGNAKLALKRVSYMDSPTLAIYRGWMLKPRQYQMFYELLKERNIALINSPEEYQFCHYLPDNYETIKAFTPQTAFRKLATPFKIEDFLPELAAFHDQPIVIKDYVKSQKHYWEEACYIPNASDLIKAEKVINRFLELQGDDLNEGLVFRKFVPLEALTTHSKSGMPLTKEFRVFIKDGTPLAIYPYWDEGDYQNVKPVLEAFQAVIPNIQSHFFTMDIAKTKTGNWIIIELGDGQVAGLPENADKEAFYQQLKHLF